MSKKYGRTTKKGVRCSLIRKNPAIPRNTSKMSPERDRIHDGGPFWDSFIVLLPGAKAVELPVGREPAGDPVSASARARWASLVLDSSETLQHEVVNRREDDAEVDTPQKALHEPEHEARGTQPAKPWEHHLEELRSVHDRRRDQAMGDAEHEGHRAMQAQAHGHDLPVDWAHRRTFCLNEARPASAWRASS